MKKSVDICICVLYYMSCVEERKRKTKDITHDVNTSRGVAQLG